MILNVNKKYLTEDGRNERFAKIYNLNRDCGLLSGGSEAKLSKEAKEKNPLGREVKIQI